ncbi:ribosomal RNA large subunit methyltransferase J [Cyphellophora europaea CBS 101466]|uniref:Ribosomal RNA large subunit methyltransferase J n=1 Tax=Cyphellophora europaea (strain CBS 101466) TaxID=1220924 RepID=W2S814_CYPE1|nr:ribosomal RNA large subunit methyltransferase J [Cyphellophora europaea CBS 101466]ETN44817.1 ribosomal RNA large subunit methyltransferase J [Cyphellophora europaea CBS 101466]
MAIQKKHGKGRLDKWYKLAKEKGYRARAAFKLIQLNKKYGFLEKSHVLLDLCAAPGSWCQIAAETMPAGSLIIGVDLAPIKPIPRTITFQGDITTDKCRATIRSHVKHLKCDTVLHDGAPNVGVAWVQDAFSQAELVLQSMKLATEFLKEGGTFVTKVFRSKDYNALLWVFKQLFTFVEATKPPSSRNVSAEIFVVCRGFKAPKKLDAKFLDPKHVFSEVEQINPNNEAKVFNPEKKKRRREGYEEGDWTQHKVVPVSEFIHTIDPIKILGETNTLSFEQTGNGDLALAALNRMPETTNEIRQCCADLKILGKKEFRTLLRWRMKVRDQFGMSAKAKKQQAEEEAKEGEEVAEVESMDEEMQMQEEMQRLKDQKDKHKRKERRKENEQKQKELVRMQMHMTAPFDIGMEQQVGPAGEGAIFNLKSAERAQDPTKIEQREMEESDDDSEIWDAGSASDDESDPEGDRLEEELDSLYADFRSRREERDAKLRAKRARKEKETDEWQGLSDNDKNEDSDDDEQPLQVTQVPRNNGLSNKAAMFFDQDIFQDLGVDELQDENDSAIELDDESDEKVPTTKSETKSSSSKAIQTKNKEKPSRSGEATSEWSDDEESHATTSRAEDPLKPNGQLDIDIITAEAMTLAHSLATGEKKSGDIVDESFNRYSFRDVEGLPEWFLDDETNHSKLQRPVTKAGAAAIKEKLRALNARPIKKVREAQGRKKFKAAQRMEKLKRKSALLAEDEGLSEKDKASSIARMMSRATKKKPKQQVKVVVARGPNRGISGRPKGTKGKYKIVDARLKKDTRAEKRLAKKNKR